DPRAEVILFGKGNENALEAVKQGAAAYFKIPVDIEGLQNVVNAIQEFVEIRKETGELEKRLTDKYNFCGIVSRNPLMLEIFSLIRRIAPYYKTVLIMGETGTGKEVIANALHASSPWSKHPFLVCNCGGLVENLIESELFGHQKGAFTGADRDKAGLFEAAGEGTLFLDEIGELPLSFQSHLLRVLQNGEFRRVGSHQISKARCRVIAATNRDLEQDVKAGRFREDLFFRISPLIIKVPALRDRKDDILLLYRALLEKFVRRTGKKIFGISRPVQSILMSYNWPGNVRELENVLEQGAMLTSESFISFDDLPGNLQIQQSEAPTPMSLADVEKRHIAMVLSQFAGNRTKAAIILRISRRALIRKIEKFGIK
ncbi:MAG: sigma-54-dependent Fis family transcriptional regulator, partial [Nitrospirae bacterium]|nr:sigma-54-dependent Fis family transcriptional regulator [Nitrospirota bacterium]